LENLKKITRVPKKKKKRPGNMRKKSRGIRSTKYIRKKKKGRGTGRR
jgi:hypothetical protein